MRALVVSDIHGNLEAFQQVIADARTRGGFDQIWSLGDLVGYGPDPGACIDLMQEHDHFAVMGNHDLAAIGQLDLDLFNAHAAVANRWTRKQLTEQHIAYLSDLELKLEINEFTVVHGSPRDPIWEYLMSEESAEANFLHISTLWCLVGHSHIPFICRSQQAGAVFCKFSLGEPIPLGNDRLIINPGGVGQPRDGDPRASYVIYDSIARVVVHHRAKYDIHATQDKMKSNGLPDLLIERLNLGR